ncbi:MAG: hypothetical protein Q9226_002906 [Calogaya cf. arnoldii]
MASSQVQSRSRDILPFLDFPREIRNKVYNELLLAENNLNKSGNRYRLRRVILKINRQITEEAYEVLYQGNQWINIQEEKVYWKPVLSRLCVPLIVLKGPPVGTRCFDGEPALVLKLRCPATPTQTPKKRFEGSFLVTSDRFEDTCLALSITTEKPLIYARISVSFRKQCRDNRRLQDKLSYCLSYLPRFDQVDATGLNPAPLRLGIIDELKITPLPSLVDLEKVLRSNELEGDLCIKASTKTKRNIRAHESKHHNSKLATKRYNRAFAAAIKLLKQSPAATPRCSDNDLTIHLTIIDNRLLPLVSKLRHAARIAIQNKGRDEEGLISLQLLASFVNAHHLSSASHAEIFFTIAEIARGRADYSLAVYALREAQDHLTDWENLTMPTIWLWRDIEKCVAHKHRMVHLALLYRSRAYAVSRLKLPNGFERQMLSGDRKAEAVHRALEMESMREAHERLMELGSEEALVVKS